MEEWNEIESWSNGGLRIEQRKIRLRVTAVISGGKVHRVTADTFPLGKKGQGLLSTNLEKRGHSSEEERRSRGQSA